MRSLLDDDNGFVVMLAILIIAIIVLLIVAVVFAQFLILGLIIGAIITVLYLVIKYAPMPYKLYAPLVIIGGSLIFFALYFLGVISI